MATIPTYDSFQVSKASRPNVQAHVAPMQNAAPAQAQRDGAAATGMGRELSAIAADMQHKANVTRVKEAENDAVKFEHNAEYGVNGFLSIQGKNALQRPKGVSLHDEVGTAYDKHAAEVAKGLGNDKQKAMYNEIIMQRKTALLGAVDGHVMQEHKRYQVGVAQGTVELGQNQMAITWGEPAKVNEARGAVLSGLNDAAQIQGWSKEQLAAEQIKALSPAHSSVILSAVDAGKTDYAREYYKQHQSEMTAGARLNATKAFDVYDELKRAQDHVDTIYAMDVTPQERMAEARKIKDPEARKNTVAGLKARFQEEEHFKQKGYEDAANAAYSQLANSNEIPASLFSAMDGKTQLAFRKLITEKSFPKEDDPQSFYDVTNMTPQELVKANLGQYVGVFKPTTWKKLVEKQAKARNGDFSFTSDLTKINATIKALKIPAKDKGAFYIRADTWAQKLGHKPSTDEINNWMQEMQTEVVTAKGYFSILDRHAKVADIHVDGVPDTVIPDIASALQARGIEVSNENILKLYNTRTQ